MSIAILVDGVVVSSFFVDNVVGSDGADWWSTTPEMFRVINVHRPMFRRMMMMMMRTV